MKKIFLFVVLFFTSFMFSQTKETFEQVKEKVSKTFFYSPEKAKKDAYKLKNIAETDLQKIIALQYLGYIYDLSGNPDSARIYFQIRLDVTKNKFAKTEHHYQAVIDYCNWGINYIDRTRLVKELTQTLSSIDEMKFRREKGLMNLLLGDIFLKDQDIDKATIYFDKSYSLIKDLKYAAADYYYRKSKINFIQQDYKSSKSNLLKGLQSFSEKEIFTYPQYMNDLGYTSIMLGEYDHAKKYLFESLHYQEKNGFHELTSETYLNLFYWAKAMNKNSLEKLYIDRALETNKGDIYVLKDIYLGFKDYYSRIGDFVNEKKNLQKFNELNDSLTNLEKLKVRTDLEYNFQQLENKKELALKERIIQKDTRIKYLYFIGTALLILLIVVILVVYFYKIRIQKKLRYNQALLHDEQLKMMQENQRKEIIREKIKVKLDERRRFSMELHDGIANEISSLKLSLSNENLNKQTIESIVVKIDKLYHEVRSFSHELDPDNITDVDFSQLVENICQVIENKKIILDKNILITRDIDNLQETVLVNLYRIIQEIVNNIIKHAQATIVKIDLFEDDKEIYLYIEDNGIGIKNINNLNSGIGLKNIKKRVQSLKGNYRFIEKKTGTAIEIKIPI